MLASSLLFCGAILWTSHAFETPIRMSRRTTTRLMQSTTSPSTDTSPTSADDNSQTQFLQKCRELCSERNLVLDKIKNARDLASIPSSPVRPHRIYRTGRVSDATEHDIAFLVQNITTLVDLRSPTELKDDPTLMREEVFGNFTTVLWKEQARNKPGSVRELPAGQEPVQKMFQWFRRGKKSGVVNAKDIVDGILQADSEEELEQALLGDDDVTMEEQDELCTLDCDEPPLPEEEEEDSPTPSTSTYIPGQNRKERHFVSLMNEFKYVKGTVGKVRKRDITKAILKSPGALLSRRVRSSCKKPFLDEINDGGLHMLNELLLRFGAPGIRYVLDLCADPNKHPIAFYCTAGKDRTGMLAALILAINGVSKEQIVEDYSLSANVYAEMNDHTAMVGALSQRNLNPETFLGAPPVVMMDTLTAIEEEYGSIEAYCDWIGFGPEQREQLRKACTSD